MNSIVRDLFRAVAGKSQTERAQLDDREGVADTIRQELESLLFFDTRRTYELAGTIRGATEQFLLTTTPGSQEGRCGPYRLIRMLGNGGMGAGYWAERAEGEVEQHVAIKFVRAGQDDCAFRIRFLRERQILDSLNHPGIARLLDAGHSDGHPYLVMEFVDGVRIDEYAQDRTLNEILELTTTSRGCTAA